ncbi:hypothetical protein [Salinivibrio costicola]|uniref:Uncharacterized protein n=1 Tax=Salinivibrio costicola TaxID=51367 RepID=A0ABX6K4Q1_SALCS|nr:hypothetical protein [Salinivibrio costicola]QIR06520.1 hypothetical protein HBA18_09170 [Salinivibrio costicola]
MKSINLFSLIKTITLTLLMSFMLLGCQSIAPKDPESASNSAINNNQVSERVPPKVQHKRLRETLLAVSHQTYAETLDQCRYFPMGYSPCEGPARYIVYSIKTMSSAEQAKLLQQVEEYNQLDQFIQELRPIASHCQPKPVPRFSLINNQCRDANPLLKPLPMSNSNQM